MSELFGGEYTPTTSEVGFIKCDMSRVAQAFFDWEQEIQSKRGVSVKKTEVEGDFKSVIQCLLPLTNVERRRYLFVPTRSEWTAFLDNGHRGTDVFAPLSTLAAKLSTHAIRSAYIPQGRKKQFPAVIFELYGPRRTDFLNYVRSIYADYDGYKWGFAATGEVQDFEEVERYSSRLIRDRFTFEMLVKYLKAFEIDAFDEDFYMPPGQEAILIEKYGPNAPGLQEFQLADLQ